MPYLTSDQRVTCERLIEADDYVALDAYLSDLRNCGALDDPRNAGTFGVMLLTALQQDCPNCVMVLAPLFRSISTREQFDRHTSAMLAFCGGATRTRALQTFERSLA